MIAKNKEKTSFSYDPLANDLIKKMYFSLMDKKIAGESLSLADQNWLSQAEEQLHLNGTDVAQINNLIKDTYDILYSSKVWNDDHKELYELLERIVFLGAREEGLKKHFDRLEATITEILYLNFLERMEISISPDGKEGRNLINYVTAALNLIIDRVGPSIVSCNAVNAFLDECAKQVLIITDDDLRIRFINKQGEALLNTSNGDIYGESLSEILDITSEILPDEPLNPKVFNATINLKAPYEKNVFERLMIKKADEDLMQVDEYLFILT